MQGKKRKSTEFTELVNSDPRFDVEDLRVVLSSKLDMRTSMWVATLGAILTTVVSVMALPNTPDYNLFAKYGMIIAVALLFTRMLRAPAPEERLARIAKDTDYLEAKEIAERRKKDSQPA